MLKAFQIVSTILKRLLDDSGSNQLWVYLVTLDLILARFYFSYLCAASQTIMFFILLYSLPIVREWYEYKWIWSRKRFRLPYFYLHFSRFLFSTIILYVKFTPSYGQGIKCQLPGQTQLMYINYCSSWKPPWMSEQNMELSMFPKLFSHQESKLLHSTSAVAWKTLLFTGKYLLKVFCPTIDN